MLYTGIGTTGTPRGIQGNFSKDRQLFKEGCGMEWTGYLKGESGRIGFVTVGSGNGLMSRKGSI